MNHNMQEGIIVLLVGMGMVFLTLIFLHQVFQNIVPFFLSIGKKKKPTEPAQPTPVVKTYKSGEEMAAIAAAVYMFMEEAHDEENAILTISKSSKSYSPWSSKIYTTHHLSQLKR